MGESAFLRDEREAPGRLMATNSAVAHLREEKKEQAQ